MHTGCVYILEDRVRDKKKKKSCGWKKKLSKAIEKYGKSSSVDGYYFFFFNLAMIPACGLVSGFHVVPRGSEREAGGRLCSGWGAAAWRGPLISLSHA